jgi:hypothetical protein
VAAERPLSVTEWLVTKLEFNGDEFPYAVVVPKFTSELLALSVVQVIVAPLDVMDDAATLETTGATSGATTKLTVIVAGEFCAPDAVTLI